MSVCFHTSIKKEGTAREITGLTWGDHLHKLELQFKGGWVSNHVLKPFLVGLFILVVLITALVLAYASSPQASEITSIKSAATVTVSPDLYIEVYPGMAECADGQDNDGDGLQDWSRTADSTTSDPDCDSARDRSEHYSGLQ